MCINKIIRTTMRGGRAARSEDEKNGVSMIGEGGGGGGGGGGGAVVGGATFAYPTDWATTEATGRDCCWHRAARFDWKESVDTMAMT